VKSTVKQPKTGKKIVARPKAPTSGGLATSLAGWLPPLVIFLATIAAFFPALRNGFVEWDDYDTLIENPFYRGLGWSELRWMFTTFKMGHYQPLSWVTFALDYLLWGLDPFGYHLSNLFIHAANAVIFYFIALELLSLVWSGASMPKASALRAAAGFAALVFAIHPLRVESVAWVTERRQVLSGFLLLWGIFCYLRANTAPITADRRRQWMAAAVIIYAFSLLAEAIGVTFPLVLLVLDLYPLRRLGLDPRSWFGPENRGIWLEKIPFLVLALLAGIIAPIAQYEAGAMTSLTYYGVMARLVQALFGLAFYLVQTIAPIKLNPLWEKPAAIDLLNWRFLLSGTLVVTISAVAILARLRWPALLAVWISYIVILSPVLGIAQSGPQFVAERYSYLSCLGWAILAGGGLLYFWQAWSSGRIRRTIFIAGMGSACVLLVGFGFLTWRQTQVWKDTETLWRHVLAVTDDSYFKSRAAHYNLGNLLVTQNRLEEGVRQLREAVAIAPGFVSGHFNLANALVSQGKLEDAIEEYHQTLRLEPTHVKARINLGSALQTNGKLDEAMKEYLEAARIRPDLPEIYISTGNLLAKKGNLAAAINQYQRALTLNPSDSEIHFGLGNFLVGQGHLDQAVEHFQAALKIKPDYVQAYDTLGRVLASQGDLDKAIELFRRAVAIQPEFAKAHENLARALAEKGRKAEAIQEYQEAVRILKSQPEAKPSS
jgi:protein O-mannosyl-transferase